MVYSRILVPTRATFRGKVGPTTELGVESVGNLLGGVTVMCQRNRYAIRELRDFRQGVLIARTRGDASEECMRDHHKDRIAKSRGQRHVGVLTEKRIMRLIGMTRKLRRE